MTVTDLTPVPEPPRDAPPRPSVIDARPLLTRGLPRHVQTWVMAGLATLILGVILLTGHSTPPQVVSPAISTPPVTVPPERIRSYQAQLAEQEARLRAEQAAPLLPMLAPSVAPAAPPPVEDALEDEERRRERTSLYADNVAFSRRVTTAPPTAAAGAATGLQPAPAAEGSLVGEVTDPNSADRMRARLPQAAAPSSPSPNRPFPDVTLPEGTLIEAVLVNRLDGTFRGPVQALVSAPVYDTDRQAVVIPAGARVLGSAAPVQAWGETRLAVAFHRVLWPDGRSLSLDTAVGLNGIGEAGLRDQVDRHYLQVFGASVAIGALSGLAQIGTRGGFDQSAADGAQQSAGASLAASTGRVLDRYLNVLPTVTIREGHRLRIVLTKDVVVPVFVDTSAPGAHIIGGVQ